MRSEDETMKEKEDREKEVAEAAVQAGKNEVAREEAKVAVEVAKKKKERADSINQFDGLIHKAGGILEFPTNEDHPNVVDDVHPNGGEVS